MALRRRTTSGDKAPPTMVPGYVRDEVMQAIHYGCRIHYRAFAKPVFTYAKTREHFIQPQDWPVLERAAQVCPGQITHHTWEMPIRVDGWQSEFRIEVPGHQPYFMWPRQPTVAVIPERHATPEMEIVHQWVEHRRDVARAWVLIEGLFNEFDRQALPLSVLHELWPDFDLLLTAIPGRHLDGRVKLWLAKFKNAPSPRTVIFPVPSTLDHLEEARTTILSMTLMPATLTEDPKDAYSVSLMDWNEVELPWAGWAREFGTITTMHHHCATG